MSTFSGGGQIETNVATMRSLKRVASGMRQTTARAGKGKFILKIINLVWDLGEAKGVKRWRLEPNRIVAVSFSDLRVERSGTEWGGFVTKWRKFFVTVHWTLAQLSKKGWEKFVKSLDFNKYSSDFINWYLISVNIMFLFNLWNSINKHARCKNGFK